MCAAALFPNYPSGVMWQTGPACRAARLDGNTTRLDLLLWSSQVGLYAQMLETKAAWLLLLAF